MSTPRSIRGACASTNEHSDFHDTPPTTEAGVGGTARTTRCAHTLPVRAQDMGARPPSAPEHRQGGEPASSGPYDEITCPSVGWPSRRLLKVPILHSEMYGSSACLKRTLRVASLVLRGAAQPALHSYKFFIETHILHFFLLVVSEGGSPACATQHKKGRAGEGAETERGR